MNPTKKPMDLTGQKFEKLTVIKIWEIVPRKDPRQRTYFWLCKCQCGKSCVVSANKLRRGQKSCGCAKAPNRLSFGRGFLNKLRQTYARGARNRGLCFELTKEQFDKLVVKNCHYCGAVPQPPGRGYEKLNGVLPVNGIDRIHNKYGYTSLNSVPCCKQCNRAKGALTLDEWKKWIAQLSTFVK